MDMISKLDQYERLIEYSENPKKYSNLSSQYKLTFLHDVWDCIQILHINETILINFYKGYINHARYLPPSRPILEPLKIKPTFEKLHEMYETHRTYIEDFITLVKLTNYSALRLILQGHLPLSNIHPNLLFSIMKDINSLPDREGLLQGVKWAINTEFPHL